MLDARSQCRKARGPVPWTRLTVLTAVVPLLWANALPGEDRTMGAPEPRTGAELADWARGTEHVEVLAFLRELDHASDQMRLEVLTESVEGREVPVAFLGEVARTPVRDPAHRDRPLLLILGSMHGDEPAGREGGLQYIRELVLGAGSDLLDLVDVIVVPQMNPDGSEVHRRENASGHDLNRDWVLAETPEVAAVLERVVTRYWPEVFVDVHNGGALPYHLTYQATLDPTADAGIVEWARGPMYRAVQEHLERQGLDMFWYSGPRFDREEQTWYWATTEPWPRKQHSYGGLQDMITVLLEVPRGHSLEVQATAAREGLLAMTQTIGAERDVVLDVVRTAREATLDGQLDDVFIELEAVPYPEPESFYVEAGGFRQFERVTGQNRTLHRPVRSRSMPWAYVLDPSLEAVVGLLRRHGVDVEVTESPTFINTERYRLLGPRPETRSGSAWNGPDFEVELVPGHRLLPAGSYVVRGGQRGGRLIPQLLEPDAVDSVTRWGLVAPLPPLEREGGVETEGVTWWAPVERLSGPLDVPLRAVP